jgi:DUF4097 and DUF4098 domain-containing protein YvlB
VLYQKRTHGGGINHIIDCKSTAHNVALRWASKAKQLINMKKICLYLVAALPVCAIHAQSGHEPYMQKSLVGQSIQQVNVETTGGNISVSGVSTPADARVEVYVWGNNGHDDLSKEEIKKRLDEDYDLVISMSDHKLTATAKPKQHMDNWRHGLSISFRVYAPVESSTLLRTSGGNIAIKNLSGATQDFRTSGGNLEVNGLSGRVTGKTSGGNISVSDSKDNVDLVTSGGNIEASNCRGNIRLVTSGGNLELKQLHGTIRANTSGGNVQGEEIDGELATHTSGGNVGLRQMSCSLETSTSGGQINVEMKELGKYLTIDNSSGDIELELPAGKGIDLTVSGSRVNASGLNNFKGSTDEKHVEGSVNGGGVPVKVDGGSGRVRLAMR